MGVLETQFRRVEKPIQPNTPTSKVKSWTVQKFRLHWSASESSPLVDTEYLLRFRMAAAFISPRGAPLAHSK